MATIKFYGNVYENDTQDLLDHQNGSGIGFFGESWGFPVPIGSSQTTTWVTTADGDDDGNQLNNNAFVDEGDLATSTQGTVSINGASAINLSRLPNDLATLNIRFEHDSAVIASQPKIIIYDRQSIDNHAINVITYVYEARHPLADQAATNLTHRASTGNVWTIFEDDGGQPTPMALTNSPGPSGLNTVSADTAAGSYRTYLLDNGLNPDDYNDGGTGAFLRHDWYVALSSSPTEIGQKKDYGLYFTVDYL